MVIVTVAAIFAYAYSQTERNSVSVLSKKTQVPAEKAIDTGRIRYGIPVRLTISNIDVDAGVQSVGLTSIGDMQDPKSNEAVGWYKYGTRPGNEGSAVIAGHFGLKGDAVFGQLKSLEKGAVISVLDDRDQKISFVVTNTRVYNYDEAPKEVFQSSSGAHLNLISCHGEWNAKLHTYTKRLVVFTEKVKSS